MDHVQMVLREIEQTSRNLNSLAELFFETKSNKQDLTKYS